MSQKLAPWFADSGQRHVLASLVQPPRERLGIPMVASPAFVGLVMRQAPLESPERSEQSAE